MGGDFPKRSVGGWREEVETLPSALSYQPHFNKLMRRKWLSSSEALDGIVGTLGAQALALRRMQDEPYQVIRWEGDRDAQRAIVLGETLPSGESLFWKHIGGSSSGACRGKHGPRNRGAGSGWSLCREDFGKA